MTSNDLVKACKKEDPQAQKILYKQYSPVLFAICRRYLARFEDAEDVLVEAFIKIFNQIHQYNNLGSFEGWMKKIVVNECLMFLRRHTPEITEMDIHPVPLSEELPADAALAGRDILKLIDSLPSGYRTVFNLYVVEGYKHREIAALLGISINTSKSQLILAKKRMQELLQENDYPDIERYHTR